MHWSHKSFPGFEEKSRFERTKLVSQLWSKYGRIPCMHFASICIAILVVVPSIYIGFGSGLLSEIFSLASGFLTYYCLSLLILNKVEFPLYLWWLEHA